MFYLCTAWAASTERPGTSVTYTNNWPPEPLIKNTPSAANIVWSLMSIVILLIGIGFLVWGWAFMRREEAEPKAPQQDPITKRSEERRVGKEGRSEMRARAGAL